MVNHIPQDSALQTLRSSTLLADIRTYEVIESHLTDQDSSVIGQLASKAAESGAAEIHQDADPSGDASMAAAIAIPVHRGGRVISVVALALKPASDGVGVFEIWEPVGSHDEVALRDGYFAHLERFSNVSSFIRFERGSGLPGQAWASGQAVIHDDLPNHPGFLRAAGASAGLLQTAIGLPVMDGEALMSVAMLISSAATPIARGFEVWNALEDKFVLEGAAYQGLRESLQISRDVEFPLDSGLPGLVNKRGTAATSSDASVLMMGREDATSDSGGLEITSGLAIPIYKGEALSSVTTLLF